MTIERIIRKCSVQDTIREAVAVCEAIADDRNVRELEKKIYCISRSNITLKTRMNE